MNRKHILFVSPSLRVGGIERALVVLANYFVKKGHKISFISCIRGHEFYKLDDGILLFEPHIKVRPKRYRLLLYYPNIAFFIRTTVKKANPDVVLVYGDYFNPLVLFSLLNTSFPVYISDRTSPEFKHPFYIKLLKKFLYPTAKGFIAQTNQAADLKREQYGPKLKIKVIPNAIRDIKLYPEIERTNTILYVGRFSWEKGPERLIKAFASIQEWKNWRLVMAGDGPLLNEMINLSIELNVSENISFLGNVNEIDKEYATASIFVLPSYHEGFPNALFEAMSAGLACIVFNSFSSDGIIINNQNGIIIESNSTEDLALAMKTLMRDKEKRVFLGKNAMKIREILSVEIIGEKLLSFLIK